MVTDFNPYFPPNNAIDAAHPDGFGRMRRQFYAVCLLPAVVCSCLLTFGLIKVVPTEWHRYSERGVEIQNDVRLIINVSNHVDWYLWILGAIGFVVGLVRIACKDKREQKARVHIVLCSILGLVVCIGIVATMRMVVWGWPVIQRAL